jgi:chromosome segregation ATPase
MAKWNEYGLKTGTSARDEVLILDSDTNTNKRITVEDIQEFSNGKMLEKENSTLTTEAKTLIGAINEVYAKNVAQDEKTSALESDIKEAGTKNTEQDEKISALESDIKEAGTKNTEQDEKISALESDISEAGTKNTEQDEKLATLESGIREAGTKNNEQDAKLEEVEKKLHNYTASAHSVHTASYP